MEAYGAVYSWRNFGASGYVHNTDPARDPYAGFGSQQGGYTDGQGYTGDLQSGLTLFGMRCYNPQSGRWLTRDPAGYAGGMNLYAYCDGDPVNNSDPSGLDPEGIIYRVVKFIGEHWRIPAQTISKGDAVNVAMNGGQVLVEGTARKEVRDKAACSVAKGAYGKDNILFHSSTFHEQPASPAFDHYQSKNGKINGHIFIRTLAPLVLLKALANLFDPTPVGAAISISQDAAHGANKWTAPIHKGLDDKSRNRWLPKDLEE